MTKYYSINPNQINSEPLIQAAAVINAGGLVAFPTETVYGLGADGLRTDSVKKIYQAKGRPSDNPLILHIQDAKEVEPLVKKITGPARILMDKFWPGPLTLIFEKSDLVPDTVSGGLHTVAIRLPENKIARELIRLAGTPIAAPSANTSGRPSPTKASHVLEDLDGKIDMVLDGGSCDIGLESTVVDVTQDHPIILRPGKITLEQLQELFPNASYDQHLVDRTETAKPRSPGMKYKHYAPKGELFLLDGDAEDVKDFILQHIHDKTAVLTFSEYPVGTQREFSLGSIHCPEEGSKRLFDYLRMFDQQQIETIYAPLPPSDGMGFALCNRMFKAAGGKIITLKDGKYGLSNRTNDKKTPTGDSGN